ncbi:MAG: hypothetical protein NC078_05140, partial [Ruminococcus sp.]|nr:hypothetical protein [Ruminococcus sp.]
YTGDGEPLGNLSWCGFRAGEEGNIENTLFQFNALGEGREELDLELAQVLCEVVCLYSTADGYRAVSNSIETRG